MSESTGMKMSKVTPKDIDAAGDAMSILESISHGYYPNIEGDADAPMYFDDEDPDHLRHFYQQMKATLDHSPGWVSRVIGGMCFVIMFDKNEIVDPDADTLEIHPKFAKAADDMAEYIAQRDKLLTPCRSLIDFLNNNPPMGESIWAVRQIREAVASLAAVEINTTPPQRIPENCGSGHCSCIECLKDQA